MNGVFPFMMAVALILNTTLVDVLKVAFFDTIQQTEASE